MSEYKSIKFSAYQLIINEEYANLKHFENINEAWNQDFEDNKTHIIHNVICKLKDEKYFLLYDNFGSPNPRPNKVYEINSKSKVSNPRSETQVELKRQLFCLYNIETKILYLNNSKSIGFIQKYLSKITSCEVIIKRIFKNIDEFVKTLSSIEKIKFIAHRDIFTSNIQSFKEIKNIFGIDEPESFTLEANYKISVDEHIRRVIEKFRNEQLQAPNSCLTCVGRDDNGIEQIFSENAFSKSFDIMVAENSEHLFNAEDVFNELIRKI